MERRLTMNENYNKIQESLSKKFQEDLHQISKNVKFEEPEVALGKIYEYASKHKGKKLVSTENVLRCLWIRKLIKKGKPSTFEIDLLYKLWFVAFDKVREVEEIILRYCTMDMLEPVCIYISKKEKPDVSIFIGEEGAFLSIRDKDGKAYTVELADLCVIVVARNILIDETYGAVIEYTKFEEEYHIEFRKKYSMNSVKTLLWEKYYGGRIKYTEEFIVEDKDVVLYAY